MFLRVPQSFQRYLKILKQSLIMFWRFLRGFYESLRRYQEVKEAAVVFKGDPGVLNEVPAITVEVQAWRCTRVLKEVPEVFEEFQKS